MENNNTVHCKFLKKDIDIGLCEDIFSVSCRALKREAVPEVNEFSREELNHACDDCPYID